jgi:HEAT repeat protein
MTRAPSDLVKDLDALFDAERAVRAAHRRLAAGEPKPLLGALEAATKAARALDDEDERALRLVRIAILLGGEEGPRVVDLLIDILGCEDPEARHAAGEALEDLAYERFKEVALGVERAVVRLPAGNLALVELPYLLADIPEPGVTKLLDRFLASSDADTVAAAIEAFVEVGDPAAAPLLAKLEKDARAVHLEDDEGEEGKATLGELAKEARELLELARAAQTSSDAGGPRGKQGQAKA